MTHPMIIWYAIVAAVLLTFLAEFIHYLTVRNRNSATHRHSLISISSERDMFYAPGDPRSDDYDDMQDDFEDL